MKEVRLFAVCNILALLLLQFISKARKEAMMIRPRQALFC